MKNGKLAIFITLIIFILFAFAYSCFIKDDRDSIKFKKEYEELNGVEVTKNLKYQKLNINSNNPIKYAEYKEIFELLEEGTGIIYLGFPNCPWCRTIIPVLFDVLDDNNIKTVLYMNILDERDKFEIIDEELVKTKEGTAGYYKLLSKLDKYLEDYIIIDNEEEYSTGEKRIYAPTVIFIKDGEIVGLHVSSVESQENGFDKLTSKQEEELYGIYEEYVLELQDLVCNENSKC